MDWMDNEVEAMWQTCPDFAPPPTVVRKIATRAVELVQARGGTMTADRLATAVSAARAGIASEVTRMVQHISTQGATVATLQAMLAERETLLSGFRERERTYEQALGMLQAKVAELEKTLASARTDLGRWRSGAEATQDELTAARAEVERLKAEAETLRAALAGEVSDRRTAESRLAAVRGTVAHQLTMVRKSLASERASKRPSSARVAEWSLVEATLEPLAKALEGDAANPSMPSNGSASAQKPCPGCVRCCANEQQACPDDVLMHPTQQHEDLQRMTGAEPYGKTEADVLAQGGTLHKCSPTCTHDDAANPGHLERIAARSRQLVMEDDGGVLASDEPSRELVKERNEAFMETCDHEDSTVYHRGAEAMRAACWEAVKGQLQLFAMGGGLFEESLKKAIEGATL